MHTLISNLNALWQVTLAGLILGAGLPLIFAVGVRFWSSAAPAGPAGSTAGRNYSALVGALLCFGIVVAAIVIGILYTAKAFIATKFGIHLFGES